MRWANSGALRLLSMIAVMLVAWLVVLPGIGRRADVRAYIERNERLGIDPSVKFYSELPAMPRIFARVSDARRNNENAFWASGAWVEK